MPMPTIKFTTKKDGRIVAWFREPQGRVRTTVGTDWTKAEQMRTLGEYGKQLQLAQCAAGLGSNGQAMPALKGGGSAVFVERVNGRAVFERRQYAQQKLAFGGMPFRDLRGPGKGGHMLDSIRINFLDGKKCTFAITTNSNLERTKAQANERRAEWWGWSPASVQLLGTRAGQIYPQGIAERLVQLGLMGATAVTSQPGSRFLRRAA